MVPPEQSFRKVRLDARDYAWLRPEDVVSVCLRHGSVLLETVTQVHRYDVDAGARSPEQVLADVCGEHVLADCIPTLKSQILDLIQRKRDEERKIDYLTQQREALVEEIRELKAERARCGLSIAEAGSGEVALSHQVGQISVTKRSKP